MLYFDRYLISRRNMRRDVELVEVEDRCVISPPSICQHSFRLMNVIICLIVLIYAAWLLYILVALK